MARHLMEMRRRSSTLAPLHVLTVQRCAAVFAALLTYGALLWLVYSVWLHRAEAEDEIRQSTMPVDYETWRTSERYRTSEELGLAAEATQRPHDAEPSDGVSNSVEREASQGDDDVGDDDEELDVDSDVDVTWHRTNGIQYSFSGATYNMNGNSNDISNSEASEYSSEDDDRQGAYEDNVNTDRGDEDEEDGQSLQFNRRLMVVTSVPQTGGEVVSLLLRWLASENNFDYVQLSAADASGPLDQMKQKRLAEKISSYASSGEKSVCVSHSSYAADFVQQDSAPPLQFSMIRDPIDRVMSSFHHARMRRGVSPSLTFDPYNGWMTLEDCLREGGATCSFLNGHYYADLTVPYFCGHHTECTRHNSRWALERAKENVRHNFATVGVLEDLNITLAVAETLLPKFFAGAWDTFFIDLVDRIGDSMVPRSLESLSETAWKRLRANLTTEYEFYDFVKQRVVQQYNAFVLGS